VKESICSGYFWRVVRKINGRRDYGYKVLGSPQESIAYIHPSSNMFYKNPQWAICGQILYTKRPFLLLVMEINPAWIKKHAPSFYERQRF